jgi:hypothetical protein
LKPRRKRERERRVGRVASAEDYDCPSGPGKFKFPRSRSGSLSLSLVRRRPPPRVSSSACYAETSTRPRVSTEHTEQQPGVSCVIKLELKRKKTNQPGRGQQGHH